METPKGQRLGYVRVSSLDQNLDRQITLLGEVDRLFRDEVSGASRTARSGLAQLMDYARAGDEVVVVSMDRLARSVQDLLAIVEELTAKGATVAFLHEAQTYRPGHSDPMSELMLGILGSVAQFERALIRERQAEGIAAAKARGVYSRRRPVVTTGVVAEVMRLNKEGVPKTTIATRVGLSRAAVYRVLDGTYQAT